MGNFHHKMHTKVSRSLSFTVGALALLLCSVQNAAADNTLYVLRGARGVITFTTQRPAAGKNFSVFSPRMPAFSRFYSLGSGRWTPRAVDSPYDDLIYGMAGLYDLDPALVKAVVHVESAFDPRARSPKGAMGLMQLMPATAERFGVFQPYIPEQNVRGGVTYLKMLHDRYSGNMRLAVAAYNCGEGLVDRVGDIPPISETQNYVKRVMRMKELYSCAIAGRKNC
ncbi:MAG: lytic transglycosylase domain-containing protein [Bdellovibrionota bacterium]